MTNQNLTIGLVVVAIVAIAGLFYPGSPVSHLLGGVTNYDEVDATAVKIGGSSGTRVGPVITGTCALIPVSYSFVASSSQVADCAVTGVVTGDYVFAEFATSSPSGAGWLISQVSASSTSGFITLRVVNNTGITALIPASVGSTTQYLVLHPVTSVPGL